MPEAQQRLQRLQQPVADEMRQVASQFKVDELQVVRDFMRQAKEVFQRQVRDAVHEAMHGGGGRTERSRADEDDGADDDGDDGQHRGEGPAAGK